MVAVVVAAVEAASTSAAVVAGDTLSAPLSIASSDRFLFLLESDMPSALLR